MLRLLAILLLSVSAFTQTSSFDMNRALQGARELRMEMRSPESLKIYNVYAEVHPKIGNVRYCYEYGAQNAFGGMTRGHAYYDQNKPSKGGPWAIFHGYSWDKGMYCGRGTRLGRARS